MLASFVSGFGNITCSHLVRVSSLQLGQSNSSGHLSIPGCELCHLYHSFKLRTAQLVFAWVFFGGLGAASFFTLLGLTDLKRTVVFPLTERRSSHGYMYIAAYCAFTFLDLSVLCLSHSTGWHVLLEKLQGEEPRRNHMQV